MFSLKDSCNNQFKTKIFRCLERVKHFVIVIVNILKTIVVLVQFLNDRFILVQFLNIFFSLTQGCLDLISVQDFGISFYLK